jgi:hypothetical protein
LSKSWNAFLHISSSSSLSFGNSCQFTMLAAGFECLCLNCYVFCGIPSFAL